MKQEINAASLLWLAISGSTEGKRQKDYTGAMQEPQLPLQLSFF